MKEMSSVRRFDAMAALAVVGCIGVLLFESIFIFELYNLDFFRRMPFLSDPVSEPIGTPVESIPAAEPVVPEPTLPDVPVESPAAPVVPSGPVG
jgi:hypothetical protein